MSLKLNSSGGGSVTLQEPSTASNQTLTLPDNTGTLVSTASTFAGTGPAFFAYRGSSQSISAATFTKVQFGTEDFDTAGCYDSVTNYRFTPNVAGYYLINSSISVDAYSNRYTAYIYKNGSSYMEGFSNTGNATNSDSCGVYALMYLNGTTDYVEIYVQGNNAGTVSGGAPRQTSFQAFLARAA
jgi:hypothetical protein